MTSNQFFIERIDPRAGTVYLEGDEHHHLARVVRIKTGDTVWVFDAGGARYLAEVTDVGRVRTRLRLIRRAENESAGPGIVLAQALIKPKNMDLIVQKAVELGVAAVVPLISSRSVAGREKGETAKTERWRKIALEAAKQSGRSTIPRIESARGLRAFVREETTSRKLFLSERGGAGLGGVLTGAVEACAVPRSVIVSTGPEGGWAPEEEDDFREHGFEPVSLGRTILRAETAAIAAVAMIGHFWIA